MKVEVPDVIEPCEQLGHVHFVGIGGAALSGLARIMAARGVTVTGSDAKDSPLLDSLRVIGIECWVGHDAGHIDGADTVVVSTAIKEDNPEVVSAQERQLRLWPRSAAVQSVLLGHTAVVVTGTHGKTTTTSMLATALISTGADPSYAIGSTLTASGLNAAAGSGDIFVAEGDESDEAILVYTPTGAIVTNVDADHLDHFGTPEAYAAVFDEFVTHIEPGGFLVCCVDDPGAARLADVAERYDVEVLRVGQAAGCDVRATAIAFVGETSTFSVSDRDKGLGTVTLQVPGLNYVVDSLAALAAGLRLGFSFGALADGLAAFRGSARRMEFKGAVGSVRVFDSYAHHPVEIAGDLQAARAVAGEDRLVVCFQPHLFSRTRIFGAAMGASLAAADEVVVMDVYAAREAPEPGISGATVADAVGLDPEHVWFEPRWDSVAQRLVALATEDSVVLTMGAGDVTEIGPQVLALLTTREGEGTSHAARL
ncbi:MAG: UDP-N-acetylmuramate--L-alanine ligase [Nocardioidaceae bacterium]